MSKDDFRFLVKSSFDKMKVPKFTVTQECFIISSFCTGHTSLETKIRFLRRFGHKWHKTPSQNFKRLYLKFLKFGVAKFRGVDSSSKEAKLVQDYFDINPDSTIIEASRRLNMKKARVYYILRKIIKKK